MAKSPKKAKPEIELEPDAWPRFGQFVREIAKTGPKHRKAQKAKRRAPPKGK